MQFSQLRASQHVEDANQKAAQRSNLMDVTNLATAMKSMQSQIAQTKQLLHIVQEQRTHFQEENKQLRGELEDVYRRMMTNPNAALSTPSSLAGSRQPAGGAGRLSQRRREQ